MNPARTQVTNCDLFLYCLYRLGGAGKYIDVEDVFMEMWRVAPARFRWRKHDVPNYKITSQAIADIRQRGDADLLLGEGDVRQLSSSGVAWVEARLPRFDEIAEGVETEGMTRRPSQRVVAELDRAPVVRAFLTGEVPEIGRDEIAVMLRCAPDAPRSVWRERLETLRSAASDARRSDLIDFLEFLEHKHGQWFKGEK